MTIPDTNLQHDYKGKDFYELDVDFPSGFIGDQMPVLLSYVAALQGYNPPDPWREFTYCELGCSTGVTLNTLAAANPHARFVGVDFNAASIAKARDMANRGGLTNIEYLELPYSDLCPDDFSGFDYITMQGSYSWLPPDIVDAVIRFLARALKPGGLFYVEFLLLPAMASVGPLTRLAHELTRNINADTITRANQSIDRLEALYLDENAHYFKFHPIARHIFEDWKKQRESYPNWAENQAHGSLSGSWVPKYVTEVAEELSAAGLSRVGSTTLPLNDLELSMLKDHQDLLAEIHDPLQIELMLDYIQHRYTRHDVFIKDAIPEPGSANRFLQGRVYFLPRMITGENPRLSVKVPGRGKIPLNAPIYNDLLRVFHGTGARLCDLPGKYGFRQVSDEQTIRAVTHIVAAGSCFLCKAPAPEINTLQKKAVLTMPHPYNRLILAQAAGDLEAVTLASTLTGGGGITLPALEALLLNTWIDTGPDKIVERSSEILRQSSARILVGSKLIPAAEVSWGMLCAALHSLQLKRGVNLARLGIIAPEEG